MFVYVLEFALGSLIFRQPVFFISSKTLHLLEQPFRTTMGALMNTVKSDVCEDGNCFNCSFISAPLCEPWGVALDLLTAWLPRFLFG